MDKPITRAEHEEFKNRLEEEDKRLGNRISVLEEAVPKIQDIQLSIKELSVNMASMLAELKTQGMRLEKLEARDGEMWRKVAYYAVTAVIGAVIGFVLTKLGMG